MLTWRKVEEYKYRKQDGYSVELWWVDLNKCSQCKVTGSTVHMARSVLMRPGVTENTTTSGKGHAAHWLLTMRSQFPSPKDAVLIFPKKKHVNSGGIEACLKIVKRPPWVCTE